VYVYSSGLTRLEQLTVNCETVKKQFVRTCSKMPKRPDKFGSHLTSGCAETENGCVICLVGPGSMMGANGLQRLGLTQRARQYLFSAPLGGPWKQVVSTIQSEPIRLSNDFTSLESSL
jgi:hypothetical protein